MSDKAIKGLIKRPNCNPGIRYLYVEYIYYMERESIPVECVPPACQPYVIWWTEYFSTWGGCPEVNKDWFEQVSSDGYQI